MIYRDDRDVETSLQKLLDYHINSIRKDQLSEYLYNFILKADLTAADGIIFIEKVENAETLSEALKEKISEPKLFMLPAVLQLCICAIYIGQDYFFRDNLKIYVMDFGSQIAESKTFKRLDEHSYFTEFEKLLDKLVIEHNSCLVFLTKLIAKKNYKI